MIMLYGANGYTGRLIAAEAFKLQVPLLLAGRKEAELAEMSRVTGFPYKVFSLDDGDALNQAVASVKVVLHAAGPFIHTYEKMIEACLNNSTHYLDITGEIAVFEGCAAKSNLAQKAGIMLMPGVGFDVVPSDCLALSLKEALPSAHHLSLAFAGLGSGFSRGTAKTMIEGLGLGGAIRKDGKIKIVPVAYKIREINYGPFTTLSATIPWGDVSTAYRTTGIPNIEVYMGAEKKLIRSMQMSSFFNFLFRMKWVKNYLKSQVDKKRPGPTDKQREEGKSYLWGEVSDHQGNKKEIRLEVPEGYKLTAITAVNIASKVLRGNFKTGYHTPAGLYGSSLIEEVEGARFF